ncbi:MAG: substrate-binding domain-containing protein, partial [Clostridia bacterium]|nr:substrate-binding domain-containing protein [Clostridia bacterium]
YHDDEYKCGLADKDGNIIAGAKWASISEFKNGYGIAAMGNGEVKDFSGEPVGDISWGVIDTSGNTVIDYQFETLAFSDDGSILLAQKDGKCGYIDLENNTVIPFKYEYANSFENGYAKVGYQDDVMHEDLSGGYKVYFGLIDTQGELVIPMDYDDVKYNPGDGSFEATLDNRTDFFFLKDGEVEKVQSVSGDIVLKDYMPFEGEKVVKLDSAPTLQNWVPHGEKYPRLDGATALFPVYSAFVEAVYPETTRYQDIEDHMRPIITCTKTNRAYERLISGEADIIFAAVPSDAQVEMAKNAGVEFELTPFGKEAFVFIVNEENPLKTVTVEEIKAIYSGETTDWADLGVENLGEIIAYQRPANSGSQTALEKLMGDTPIMEAPAEKTYTGMDEIVNHIEYRNLPNAIGYTFRFYCTQMLESRVKLLEIDGVAPTVENIRNDAYPITNLLYMVTRKGDISESAQAFMDWVLSEQGAELIEKAGYVPIS